MRKPAYASPSLPPSAPLGPFRRRILYLGPDTAANLLEVVTVVKPGGDELVIHAMLMQKKYQPLLRGLGERT